MTDLIIYSESEFLQSEVRITKEIADLKACEDIIQAHSDIVLADFLHQVNHLSMDLYQIKSSLDQFRINMANVEKQLLQMIEDNTSDSGADHLF